MPMNRTSAGMPSFELALLERMHSSKNPASSTSSSSIEIPVAMFKFSQFSGRL